MSADGLCECGCGRKTTIAKRNYRDRGIRKGQPIRFVAGHSPNCRKSAVDYIVDSSTGCWLWQLAINKKGYGETGLARAHRASYEQHRGPIPAGMEIDHLCRNRACVNPAHLEAVTHAENIRRSSRTKLDWEKVRHIRGSSESRDELAARFGVSRGAIEQIIANNNWPDPNYVAPSKRGVIIRPKIAKLTPDDAVAIRASPLSNAELARRYRVAPASIRNVRRGVTFRYLLDAG